MKIKNPFYLTAGNFPSAAANTIQVAKMAEAYSKLLPDLKVVALTGFRVPYRKNKNEIKSYMGLSKDLNILFLPLLVNQKDLFFNQDYRPPAWFYKVVSYFAKVNRSNLIFTRKPETAITSVRFGINTILETHVPWESLPHIHKYKKYFFSKYLLSVVVVTEPIAESFYNVGLPRKKIIIEPDGVDLSQYQFDMSQEQIRKELNLSNNKKICMYTGHLYKDRGIETLINAANKFPDIDFYFVGGWEKDVRYYKEYSENQNILNTIFTGFIPQSLIPKYQYAADILFMQYSAKTHHSKRCSPIKVFEYLASGRPIISTDLPILRSILKNEYNAVLVEPDSKKAIINAINYLISNPEIVKIISNNALIDSSNYSWDERARRILNRSISFMEN